MGLKPEAKDTKSERIYKFEVKERLKIVFEQKNSVAENNFNIPIRNFFPKKKKSQVVFVNMFDTISSYGSLLLLFLISLLFAFIYQFVLRSWFYFSDGNVKFVRGLPLLGSAYKSVIGLEPAAISYRRLYERFAAQKFIGIYDLGGRPSYLLRDPDLIKQLLITDFNHFAHHRFTFENENNLFAHTLFGVCDSKWQQMRSTVSPVFTGERMRLMHELMVKQTEQFIVTLKETDKIAKMFNSRDLFTRYANDIIAKTVFGIEMNSLRDIDNDF